MNESKCKQIQFVKRTDRVCISASAHCIPPNLLVPFPVQKIAWISMSPAPMGDDTATGAHFEHSVHMG